MMFGAGHRNNSFELLGFDILLDEHGRSWLLEVNDCPGLHLTTDIVRGRLCAGGALRCGAHAVRAAHHGAAVEGMFKVLLDERARLAEVAECDSSDAAFASVAEAGAEKRERCSSSAGDWELIFRGEAHRSEAQAAEEAAEAAWQARCEEASTPSELLWCMRRMRGAHDDVDIMKAPQEVQPSVAETEEHEMPREEL